MKTFQKKFVALSAVAGLAVLGAACESESEVESPGVEEPADDVIIEEDTGTDTGADTGADTGTDTGADTGADTGTDTGTEGDLGTDTETDS